MPYNCSDIATDRAARFVHQVRVSHVKLFRTNRRVARHRSHPSCLPQDPACTDMADLLRKGRALASKNKKETGSASKENRTPPACGAAKTGGVAAAPAATAAASASGNEGCPLDKGELGAATWGLVRSSLSYNMFGYYRIVFCVGYSPLPSLCDAHTRSYAAWFGVEACKNNSACFVSRGEVSRLLLLRYRYREEVRQLGVRAQSKERAGGVSSLIDNGRAQFRGHRLLFVWRKK